MDDRRRARQTPLSDPDRQPDRRRFLRASAAALAAVPLASPVLAGGPLHAAAQAAGVRRGPGHGRRQHRKAVKLGMVRIDGSLADRFAVLAELGFDGVELDSPNDLDTDDVLAAQESSGIRVHGVVDSVHWRMPFSDPDPDVRARARAALETALRDAKAYGATSVLVVPAVVSKRVGYAEAYTRSLAEIRRVVPLAEELGIDILLENVWNGFLLSPLEAARYIDELGSERVGAYFDVGNVVNFGWPEHWIEVLGKRIGKIDVKEFSRAKRDAEGLWKGFGVELLEGDCDWPAVMQALDAVGYDAGWFTAEVGGGGRERLSAIAERMDRILVAGL